ncbi:MAG: acetyltransferase [Parvibaculales bacterium]
MEKIGIFGLGGMAREARDIANSLSLQSVFIASDEAEKNSFSGVEDVVLESEIMDHADMPYVIAIGEGSVREEIALSYAGKLQFANLIHPSATFGYGQRERLEERRGLIICAGSRITCDTQIGDFSILNLNATISHDCIVEDYVTIAPQACVLGNVHIGRGAWVGASAVINQGKNGQRRRIGENCVIGSGAVVTSDCEAGETYIGVPARKLVL